MGLAFKPATDDMREAPSLCLIENHLAADARVRACDPMAMEGFRCAAPQEWFANGRLALVATAYEAVSRADALALVTEWRPFRRPDFVVLRKLMKQPIIFDGRNQLDPKSVRAAGFEYSGIGR